MIFLSSSFVARISQVSKWRIRGSNNNSFIYNVIFLRPELCSWGLQNDFYLGIFTYITELNNIFEGKCFRSQLK